MKRIPARSSFGRFVSEIQSRFYHPFNRADLHLKTRTRGQGMNGMQAVWFMVVVMAATPLTALAAPSLTKTGTGPAADFTFTMAGDVLNYQFVFLNTDVKSYALPPEINDDLIPDKDISCPAVDDDGNNDGQLDTGETVTCTGTYTVLAGDVANGFVTNCATADFGGITTNQSCLTFALDLSVVGVEIDLFLCLDGSGSISPTDWVLQLNGTQEGLFVALVPTFPNGKVRVTVIVFSDDASVEVGPTIIDSQFKLDNFQAAVGGLVQPGDFTDQADCITLAQSIACPGADGLGRGDCPDNGVRRIIDISTDGDPTTNDCPGLSDTGEDSQICAEMRSDEAEAAGMDVVNVIGVGSGFTLANAEAWVFPTPVQIFDAALMESPEPGDEGFIVLVAHFTDYESPITAKINAEVATSFTVNKVYSDATVTPVEITLACNGSTVIEDDTMMASPDVPAVFMLSDFGFSDTCTAVETNGLPAGYIATEADCAAVEIVDDGECTITNTPEPPPPELDMQDGFESS